MKKLLTILLLALATSTIAQTDSISDTVSIDSYVTNRDSPDSSSIEMTPEELDEVNAYINGKPTPREKVDWALDYPQGVLDNINQNAQDYSNFYYRKKRTTLIGLLLP